MYPLLQALLTPYLDLDPVARDLVDLMARVDYPPALALPQRLQFFVERRFFDTEVDAALWRLAEDHPQPLPQLHQCAWLAALLQSLRGFYRECFLELRHLCPACWRRLDALLCDPRVAAVGPADLHCPTRRRPCRLRVRSQPARPKGPGSPPRPIPVPIKC